MNKPHKHAEVIKAWADGAEIEYRSVYEPEWGEAGPRPHWLDDVEYRVKPERVYPVTGMDQRYLESAGVLKLRDAEQGFLSSYQRDIANAALRHAIDAGQVLLPPTKD